MDSKKVKWLVKYDTWSAQKSDMQLAEVCRKGDAEERDIAIRILQERYRAQLRGYIARKLQLPSDWVDDVEQQTWIALDSYLATKSIREGVDKYYGL